MSTFEFCCGLKDFFLFLFFPLRSFPFPCRLRAALNGSAGYGSLFMPTGLTPGSAETAPRPLGKRGRRSGAAEAPASSDRSSDRRSSGGGPRLSDLLDVPGGDLGAMLPAVMEDEILGDDVDSGPAKRRRLVRAIP
jgi:hypothetical protein